MGGAESPYLVGERLGLTIDETGSITRYISSDSYKINEKLRNNLQLSVEDKTFIALLDSALEKLPNYDGMVYRSIDVLDADAYIREYVVGYVKQFQAYTSSSTGVYDDRLLIQYVIKSETGKDIREFNFAEAEILFKRDTLFLVEKVIGHTIYMTEV